MKIDPAEIREKIEAIAYGIDESSGDITDTFKPIFEDPELKALKDLCESLGVNSVEDLFEMKEGEWALIEDSQNAVSDLVDNTTESLRLFCDRKEEEFYSSLQPLAVSIRDIYWNFSNWKKIYMTVKSLFRECDPDRYAENEGRIWMTVYLNIDDSRLAQKILNDISGISIVEEDEPRPDLKELVRKFLEDCRSPGSSATDDLRRHIEFNNIFRKPQK